ncbi:MAG: helix-turn-helix domain-containing protein [Muribaculaceae bacterium]|nr:helix-turn-helix domain-containing protein [Muribaculaceae bacterium]
MDIISRLKQYMTHCQLTSSQFADKAGIPRPTLSQLLNGRPKNSDGVSDGVKEAPKKISSDLVDKLHNAYPNLNVMWLLFGEGDMENHGNMQFSEPQNSYKSENLHNQTAENQNVHGQILFDDELSDLTPKKNISPEIADLATSGTSPSQKYDYTPPIRHENPTPTVSLNPDKTKRVQSIMVFYSDNSFEIFKPAE